MSVPTSLHLSLLAFSLPLSGRAIVSKMASAEINFMLRKLVLTRDSRFLLFLSNLCVCDGRPIPSTQGLW